MDKKDLEFRLNMWHTTLREVRQFFNMRGFIEIPFTPLLVTSPGMEPNLDPMEVDIHLIHPERAIKSGLITSPEYSMKRLMGAGFDKIFTITPVFRNGEADGGQHGPEFTMLEWYAKGDYADLLKETELFLQTLLGADYKWPYITYVDAHMENDVPHVSANSFFITQYPKEKASLSRIHEQSFAERFEAYVGELELCNGFCELTDSEEQRKRFLQESEERAKMKKTIFPIDECMLEALSKIKEPIYGNALGLDRLIMVKYGIGDINSIQLFPFNERYQYGITK